MKWGLLLFLPVLVGCANSSVKREQLGREIDGAYYHSGSFVGGVGIYVYPSGTVQYQAFGGKKVTFIDKSLWRDLANAVERGSGLGVVDEWTDEGALCDGGWSTAYVRMNGKNGYYHSENDNCGDVIDRSDQAGREAYQILADLARKLDARFNR